VFSALPETVSAGMNNTLKLMVEASSSTATPEAAETRRRLEKCWAVEVDWNHYPERLSKVRNAQSIKYSTVRRLVN